MDIKFARELTRQTKQSSINLIENEIRIKNKCDELNYTYNGYVVSDRKPSDMHISLTCNTHNETWNTTTVRRFLAKSGSGCSGCFHDKRVYGGKTTPKEKLLSNAIKACEKFNLICDGFEDESGVINQRSKIKVSCSVCKKYIGATRYTDLVTSGRICRYCDDKNKLLKAEEKRKEQEKNKQKNMQKTINNMINRINDRCAELNYTFLGFKDNSDIHNRSRLILKCNVHNNTWDRTRYNLFVRGDTKGCPWCRTSYAFRTDIPVYFYIQTLDDKYIKFGVSNRKPETRMMEQQKESTLNHKLIRSYRFFNGHYGVELEELVKSKFKCGVVSRDVMRDGHTETLEIDKLHIINMMVDKYINEAKISR